MREELYAQCFDELIRQVTINCAERGLLLLRVRDEARMSIAAYQTLYESSVAFGMRKALGGEQGKSDAEARIAHLEEATSGCEAAPYVLVDVELLTTPASAAKVDGLLACAPRRGASGSTVSSGGSTLR